MEGPTVVGPLARLPLDWAVMTDDAATTPPRLDAITGLRWWAAFAVYVYHFPNLAPLPQEVAMFSHFGNLGVTFFFVLSGFVLTWSMRPSTTKRTFYWRRFARIYPLHLVTLLCAVPVFYSFRPDPAEWWVKPFDVGVLLLCVLLLQGWSRDPVILFAGNPASWTLTVEAFFYALHPYFAKVIRRVTVRGSLIIAGGVLALTAATRTFIVAQPDTWLAGLPWPVLRLPEFVLGICLAWAVREGWRPRIPFWLPLALLAAWVSALALLPATPAAPVAGAVSPYVGEVTAALCAMLIVTTALRDLEGRGRLSRARPIVLLGEWSYAFYLIHATLIYAALGLFGPQPGGWRAAAWFAALLVASIAAAAVLHAWIERPAERRLRAWESDRRATRDRRRGATAAR